jgi:tetratricopeptide (TPR) repeat protein
MYVHLCEMSSNPSQALIVCETLRYKFPHGGHLVHMATHIDVLVGDYDKCVAYNIKAKEADSHVMTIHPAVAGPETFYFGYIAHNYHMGVYGAILGGYERIGMDLAGEINTLVNEQTFEEHPDLVAYLETYASLEIHVMIRFGRWKELIDDVALPKNERLMLYRTSQIRYGRALAFAMLGDIDMALHEAKLFDTIRKDPDAPNRILHNNTVADLLELDSIMMHGEILYKAGKYNEGLALLKKATTMQDNLNYDEPWGKMQPIRHAYGGLLCEQGFIDEAIAVFRTDLKIHPNNPWALVGLLECLTKSTRCHTTFDATVTHTFSYDTITTSNGISSPDPDTAESTNAATTATCCKTAAADLSISTSVAASKPNKKKKNKKSTLSSTTGAMNDVEKEIEEIKEAIRKQRLSKYADYDIAVPCECCIRKYTSTTGSSP